jgi:hypothetical protein
MHPSKVTGDVWIEIWDAASPPQSLGFTLVGALFIIPFVLAYTAWSYYVFRGKVKTGATLLAVVRRTPCDELDNLGALFIGRGRSSIVAPRVHG